MDEQSKEQENLEVSDIKVALESREYKYELTLGKGSYGLVVQAEHPIDERRYAIKILRIVQGETAKYQKRELDVLTKSDLWKQNIVKYYCCWQMPIGGIQCLCIQMELCWVNLEAFVYNNEMGNAKIIQSQGPPRFYERVFPQILNGLSAMHSMGLVHRDIHISNILIANPKPTEISQIDIRIADFGLSREIGSVINTSPSLTNAPKLEKLSSGVGNKLFRAPELETEYYDYKVDLYSSGIVLYFLSRYLEDKKQWRAEIQALKNGERDRQHLCHQDDKTVFNLIKLLLQEDPTARPSAEKALIIMQSKKCAEVPMTDGKNKAKKFYIKKDGEGALRRCSTENDTFDSLQEGIQSCLAINPEFQELHQKTTVNDKEEMIKILTDLDVRAMFQSAEKEGKDVIISVSEKVPEMDVSYGTNPPEALN